MKSALSFCFCLLASVTIYSQTPYYTSKEIRDSLIVLTVNGFEFKIDEVSIAKLGGHLKNYLPDSLKNKDLNAKQIITIFKSNPFFGKELLPLLGGGASPFAPILSSVTTGIGGVDVTAFADGLAKFLVKRTKEELYVSFFENLADDEKLPEFKILFPRTKELVDNFKSWEYANVINTLKESFEKDLKELLKNLPQFGEIDPNEYNDKAKERLAAIKKFFDAKEGKIILAGLRIGDGVIAGDKLPNIINDLGSDKYLGGMTDNTEIKNSFRLLNLLSLSLKSNSPGKSYISKSELRSLFDDAVAIRIFLGLIYQQIKNESIKIGNINIADAIQSGIADVKPYLENLINAADDISNKFKELRNAKAKAEVDLEEYWAGHFDSFKDFISQLENVGLLHSSIKLPPLVDSIFSIGKQTLEIAHDISVRNYSAAIIATLNFIIRNSSHVNTSGFTIFFVKYGSFAANVAQAKNSDDVEKAIESVALPVGSASIKKYSSFNVAINAYVGLFGGQQKQRTDTKYVGVAGVYAPVGVTFSKGLGNPANANTPGKKYRPASFSVFASIIDISPLVTYRFSNYNDTLANDIKIRLNQIFSPGMHAVFGLPKKPISFGGGFNWTPLLSKVEKEKITVLNAGTKPLRWQIFLAVDIPIINFYTKSK